MCVCVYVCMYVCVCVCVYVYVCLVVCPTCSVSLRLWWKQQTKMVLWFTSFNHQRRIIRPLGANWGHPLTNHKCQLTSVAPYMAHDTSEPTTVFTIIQFTRQFLSILHVTWSCTVSIRSLTHPHTHMLSPSTSPSIIHSLMANLIAIESRDDDGREAKRDEEDIPIGKFRPRRRWLRTLSRWPLSIKSFVPYASSALPQFKH